MRYKALLLFSCILGCAVLFAGNACNNVNTNNKAANTLTNTAANSTMNTGVSNNKANTNGTTVEHKRFLDSLPADFQPPTDDVGKKLLMEYGALFVTQGKVALPKKIIFKDAADVSGWQAGINTSKEMVGGVKIELQFAAMAALKDAAEEAKKENLTITPRGSDAARRSYEETEDLWASRVNPGLKYWVEKGKLSEADAEKIRAMSPFEQVPEIFKLESEGMFFSKDLSKTIIYSVAPPGASQHLSMLALDVSEHENAKVREILARHGWFQTVVSDLPHFTFLAADEKTLLSLGLKKAENGGRSFWIPD
jgi:hypothetical protein